MNDNARRWRTPATSVAAATVGVLFFAGVPAAAQPLQPVAPQPGPAVVSQTAATPNAALTPAVPNTALTVPAAPNAALIVVHLDAIAHCVETRPVLNQQLLELGVRDLILIPDDGENHTFQGPSGVDA